MADLHDREASISLALLSGYMWLIYYCGFQLQYLDHDFPSCDWAQALRGVWAGKVLGSPVQGTSNDDVCA